MEDNFVVDGFYPLPESRNLRFNLCTITGMKSRHVKAGIQQLNLIVEAYLFQP
jgi:hypothetical protein